jgi:hypothetical protein
MNELGVGCMPLTLVGSTSVYSNPSFSPAEVKTFKV